MSKNVAKLIYKLGGTVSFMDETKNRLEAICNGYDVNQCGSSSFVTLRKISDRGTYDQGSDYNPGGYMFLNKLKQIEYYLQPTDYGKLALKALSRMKKD
jgi:hypothetical protein